MKNNSLILVAEDEADIADILKACLQREGFSLLHAENGVIALTFSGCSPPKAGQKKARARRAKNTGSNVSNVVLFFGRATVEAQRNNNHSHREL